MENVRGPNIVKNNQNLFSSIRTWFSGLSSNAKRIAIGVLVLVALGLFILGNIFLFRYGKTIALRTFLGKNIPTPTPTPTPYPINRHGKLNFTVASGKKTGPQFQKGFVDPYDVKEQNPQRLSFNITHSTPIKSVKAIWQTDTKKTEVPLALAEGTETEGRWEGAWIADDTYLYHLSICAIASDGIEENRIDITLR